MKGLKARIRKNKATRWLLILSNWLSQGIWHMDKTEKMYRVFFTIFLTVFLFLFFDYLYDYNFLILTSISFFLAHTINWLVNSNLFTLFVHRLLLGGTSKEDFFNYMIDLEKRAENEESIIGIYCFGSLSRGELNIKSDLDISFLRKEGGRNASKAILFFTNEKKIAQSLRIPTESFLCDNVDCLKKRYSIDEFPMVIKDKYNTLTLNYDKILTIVEAKELNK